MYWLLTTLLPYLSVFLYLRIRLRRPGIKDRSVTKSRETSPGNLTVIIPLRDEAANLDDLISDLGDQSLDRNLFEIIFVDDGSTDSTPSILSSLPERLPGAQVLRSVAGGKKNAIALALEHARGEYIVSTDGDCRMGREWLKSIYTELSFAKSDMIIGPVDIIDRGRFLNRLVQLEFLALQSVTEAFARLGKPVLSNGANLCFINPGPEAYRQMVKPHLQSGDDIFLMESYSRKGKKITWLDMPGALVLTHGPSSLASFIRQRIRWTSKSTSYSDPLILGTAALVFLTNMLLLLILLASISIPGLRVICIYLYLIKSVPDFAILYSAARKRNKGRLLYYFIPAQLLYPPYVFITGLSGLITGLFSSRQGR